MAKKRKPRRVMKAPDAYTCTVAEAVSEAFSTIEEIASECREETRSWGMIGLASVSGLVFFAIIGFA